MRAVNVCIVPILFIEPFLTYTTTLHSKLCLNLLLILEKSCFSFPDVCPCHIYALLLQTVPSNCAKLCHQTSWIPDIFRLPNTSSVIQMSSMILIRPSLANQIYWLPFLLRFSNPLAVLSLYLVSYELKFQERSLYYEESQE